MPTYVYECPNCSFVLEVIQKITEKKNPRCSRCVQEDSDGFEMKTVMQPSSFSLKGSGWTPKFHR